jgi:hypothetical protein
VKQLSTDSVKTEREAAEAIKMKLGESYDELFALCRAEWEAQPSAKSAVAIREGDWQMQVISDSV